MVSCADAKDTKLKKATDTRRLSRNIARDPDDNATTYPTGTGCTVLTFASRRYLAASSGGVGFW